MARRSRSSARGAIPPTTVDLSKLYFGKDDAESDIARGGLLKQGFMKTHAYNEALSGSKTLVIGRKGSGKSAICLMLLASADVTHSFVLVTPDAISAEEVRRFQLSGIPQEQSKSLTSLSS
jgi:ABC-type multidrug transport system fused ATPase/permease subunit